MATKDTKITMCEKHDSRLGVRVLRVLRVLRDLRGVFFVIFVA
jgi:hypothetical protein